MLRVIVATALLAVMGCSTRSIEEPAEDVLSFDVVDFHVESSPGCDSVGAACAFYHASYPQFHGLANAVSDSIQTAIDRTLTFGDPDAAEGSFRDVAEKFVDDYKKFTAEFNEPSMGWYFAGNVTVNMASDTLISLVTKTEFYTGGAHGGTGTYFSNIDPATGMRVSLEKIYGVETVAQIRTVGEEIFRNVYDLGPDGSLAEAGYTFVDDRFALNENYGFTERGLVFVYNIYEIAPYAMGQQEIVIPYSRISMRSGD